jgi:hypothetical protein
VRRLALGLGIAFSLAMWLAGLALVDLVGTWFLGEPGTVSDLGYGALGGIVVPAASLLAWKDARALRQVFAAAMAYALAGAVSTDHRYLGLAALVATAALVLAALLPDRGAILAPRPSLRSAPSPPWPPSRSWSTGFTWPGTSPTASLPTTHTSASTSGPAWRRWRSPSRS